MAAVRLLLILLMALTAPGCAIVVDDSSSSGGGSKQEEPAPGGGGPAVPPPMPPNRGKPGDPTPPRPVPETSRPPKTTSPPRPSSTATLPARLSIAGVRISRYAPGASICSTRVTVRNDGRGRAADVVVKATVKTLTYPIYTQGLAAMYGPTEIAAGRQETYVLQIPFAIDGHTPLAYTIELRRAGALIARTTNGPAVYCAA